MKNQRRYQQTLLNALDMLSTTSPTQCRKGEAIELRLLILTTGIDDILAFENHTNTMEFSSDARWAPFRDFCFQGWPALFMLSVHKNYLKGSRESN